MQAVAYKADLPVVTTGEGYEDTRGGAIKRRVEALGIGDREWHEATGIDRKTLNRAIENVSTVRPSTYTAIEAELDKLEALKAGRPAARVIRSDDPGVDMMEVTVEGNFGVRAVVKGPVRDSDVIQSFVRDLMRGMERRDPKG